MIKPIAHLVVVVFAAACPVAALSQPAESAVDRLNMLRTNSDAIEELVSRVMPSVVQVVVTRYAADDTVVDPGKNGLVRRGRSIGSGVVVDPDGYILTNAHVVEGAERVQVLLTASSSLSESIRAAGSDSRLLDAHVLGTSDQFDLALLSVDVQGLPSLPIADYSSVRQGQLVFAFGNPDALRDSVTMGIVSAVAQQAEPGSPLVWIQTDAAVNPGNSGGPLVNVDGELIGLNAFIRSMSGGNEGLGFAVPSAVIAFAYPQLRDFGHLHRAVLGVSAQTITRQLKTGLKLPTDAGVIASDVVPGGAGAAAGLRIGDIILAMNGRRLDSMSLPQFYLSLFTLTDGQRVVIEVLRGSESLTLIATATVPPHDCARPVPLDLGKNIVDRLGIIGSPVDETIAHMLPKLRLSSGVLVMARVDTPQSAQLGLRRGDIIHAVNGNQVGSPAELRDILTGLPMGEAVVIQVARDRAFMFVEYEIE